MIKHAKGDLLLVETGLIVHGCNAQGVMGSGVAKQIRETYPEAYSIYKNFLHNSRGNLLGKINPYYVNDNKFIINAITQSTYGYEFKRYVSYDAIADAFTGLVQYIEKGLLPKLPICFPKIGAGLGGGNWDIISNIIDITVPDRYEKWLYEKIQ